MASANVAELMGILPCLAKISIDQWYIGLRMTEIGEETKTRMVVFDWIDRSQILGEGNCHLVGDHWVLLEKTCCWLSSWLDQANSRSGSFGSASYVKFLGFHCVISQNMRMHMHMPTRAHTHINPWYCNCNFIMLLHNFFLSGYVISYWSLNLISPTFLHCENVWLVD